jgi:hypothetical protein
METYHKNSAADEYWFGFVLGHMLYVVCGLTFDELAVTFKADRASSKRGGFLKIRIKATTAVLTTFANRAICLGDESLLNLAGYNKGEAFEKIITERYTTEQWAKDSVPFWMDGDATINGKKVQIKLNGAELTNEKTLRKYFG